jgi:hypothetical protein
MCCIATVSVARSASILPDNADVVWTGKMPSGSGAPEFPPVESGPMSERLAILTTARERMIEDRDAFTKVLAGPPDRDRSERARAKFVELQTLIEAIERAIEGERRGAHKAQLSAVAAEVR